MNDRAPEPNDRNSEQAVLGALMLKPDAYWKVADFLHADDFHHAAHGVIFNAIAELCRNQQPCDEVTLGSALEDSGRIDAAGGIAYVMKLAAGTPGAANIVAYAERVSEKAELRRVRAAGRQIAQLDGEAPSGVASALLSAAARPAQHKIQAMGEVMKAWYHDLEARFRRSGNNELTGVHTGLDSLDELLGGWQPGSLVLLAARPSMGKTALALHFARAAAEAKSGVLIFTIEMPSGQLMSRLVSSVAHIGSDAIRSPATLAEEAWSRITTTITQFASLPIRFDESSTLTLDGMLAKTRQAHARLPVRVILIDYLQLMTPPKAERNDIGLGEITRACKALAKTLGATVILLSQLNRKCEDRGDRRPLMSDLRDSGSIEQDADIVLMLYRDEQYNPRSDDKGHIEILVRKHRDGATGMLPVAADLRFGQFHSVDSLPSAHKVHSDAPPPLKRSHYTKKPK